MLRQRRRLLRYDYLPHSRPSFVVLVVVVVDDVTAAAAVAVFTLTTQEKVFFPSEIRYVLCYDLLNT